MKRVLVLHFSFQTSSLVQVFKSLMQWYFPWELVVILKHNQYYVFLKNSPWHLFSSFYSTYIFSNLNSVRSSLQDFFVHSVGGNGLQHIIASLYALNCAVRCDFKVWEDTTLIVFFTFRLIGPGWCLWFVLGWHLG